MIYEFECPKGHVTEDDVPMGTKVWPCAACIAECEATNKYPEVLPQGLRILSPTRTTFRFADTRS